MDSNEEYLDQLLRSLTEGDSSKEEEADDGIGDLLNQFSEEPHSVPEDLISGLLGGSESTPEGSVDDIMANLSGEMPEGADNTESEMAEMFAGPEMPETAEIFAEPEMPEAAEIFAEPEMPEAAESSAESEMPEAVESSAEPEMTVAVEMADEPISLEEAEAEMLFAAEEPEPESEFLSAEGEEDDDLGSLLESLGAEGDEDVREISDLLDKAERDEPIVDIMDSMPPEISDEAEEASSKKSRKKKKERVKKEKKTRRSRKKQEAQDVADSQPEESAEGIESLIEGMQQETEEIPPEGVAVKEKKQGFWGKLLNTLTQEDEEDTEDPADLISDENGAIMEQLDKEDKNKGKGKKKKKADKKGKGKNAADAGDDEDLEEAPDDKKKKKKEKKPKKEKPAASVEELLPGKKLSIKKILPVVLVALVFCAAYVIVSQLYISYVNKQRAEEAYYAGDYLECYGLLLGQDLNESQELIYHKSELVLQMERIKGNYQRLVLEGKELEALDYLVQSVCRREEFYLKAQEWGCLDVVEQTFAGLTGLLNANYSLDEAHAMEIAALNSDVDYTIALLNVLKEAHGPEPADEEAGGQEEQVLYEDLLPEEEEITDTEFVDTIG